MQPFSEQRKGDNIFKVFSFLRQQKGIVIRREQTYFSALVSRSEKIAIFSARETRLEKCVCFPQANSCSENSDFFPSFMESSFGKHSYKCWLVVSVLYFAAVYKFPSFDRVYAFCPIFRVVRRNEKPFTVLQNTRFWRTVYTLVMRFCNALPKWDLLRASTFAFIQLIITQKQIFFSRSHEYQPLSPLISWVNPF